jgi:hypothetical protein
MPLTTRDGSGIVFIMRRMIETLGVMIGIVAGWAVEPAPDFHLADANMHSLRFNTQVSPRDYILQVSGYYFATAS